MSLLFFLAVVAASAWAFPNEELFRENESIDSVMEKKAYFAFKLKNEKLERRVMLIQELSKQLQTTLVKDPMRPNLSAFLVPVSALELRLASFYYDEAEHGATMNEMFAEVARSLCSSFPRHLTFNRFALDGKMIRGHMQNGNMGEQAVNRILVDNGFSTRWVSDVYGGDKSGFVVVKNGATYKTFVQDRFQPKTEIVAIHPAAKIFLQKPLRTSVYVDTLSVCRESSTGSCEEIASIKIENCKKGKTEL